MIRVRFAPSPTGYLHLGNIRTALFNYLFAKKNDGAFILRVEDTDQERSKEEYLQSQMEDLLWMGIRWDEGPEKGGEFGPYRQSERMDLYRKYIDQLIHKGQAYYCYVTEEETDEMKQIARLEKKPPRFDNRGRTFTQEEIEKRKAKGIKPTVRFKIENPELKYHDLIRGDVAFNLDDMVGDFVIQRADGMPTFHLAVCVDDGLMQISHVFRGEDHLSNTPKHILLMRAMGFEPPQYGHLSLVHGPGGEPLSKRLASVSIREFRRKGYLPWAVQNYICLLGWAPAENREILTLDELMKEFEITKVSRSSSNFDPDKLDWVNGQHLRLLPDHEFVRLAMVFLKNQDALKAGQETALESLLPVFKDNIERFEQLVDRLQILEDEFDYEDVVLLKSPECREIVAQCLSILEDIPFAATEETYAVFIERLKSVVKLRGKQLMLPVRLVLTGRLHGPELKKFFSLLGKEKIQSRFQRASELQKKEPV